MMKKEDLEMPDILKKILTILTKKLTMYTNGQEHCDYLVLQCG